MTTTFLNDTFTATDGTALASHTADSGATWTKISGSGTASIRSNQVYSGGGATADLFIASAVAATADATAVANIALTNGNNGSEAGLVLRADAAGANGYVGCFFPYDAGKAFAGYRIYRLVSGVYTQIAQVSASPPSTSGAEFKFTATGSGASVVLTCYVNGTSVLTYTDTNAARITVAGRAGLYMNKYTSPGYPYGYFFKDLVASDTSSGTSYTLSADAASFAMTGVAAGLHAARRVAASAASFAMTGAAANVGASRKLSAGVGSYALAGATSSLRIARKLTAGVGAFALTGAAAATSRGYHLSASIGAFVFTGADADLHKVGSYTLSADPGAFSIAASDTRLAHSRVLAASPGSFAADGAAVSLQIARKLSAGAGAFALTGAPATLRWTGALSALTPDPRFVAVAPRRIFTARSAGRTFTAFTNGRIFVAKGGYDMFPLPGKTPVEEKVVTFDFSDEVAEGSTLSDPAVAKSLAHGTDADAASLVLGDAVVIGNLVLVLVSEGLESNRYGLNCVVQASNNEVHEIAAQMLVSIDAI